MSHGGDAHIVTLIVQPYRADDPDPALWAHVESGGKRRAVFQYRFEPPFGAVRVTVGKPNTVHVRLKGDKDTTLHDLRIESDPFQQLRVVREQCTADEFVIENANDRVQVAYYSIFVKAGDEVLACDPMIFNRPR